MYRCELDHKEGWELTLFNCGAEEDSFLKKKKKKTLERARRSYQSTLNILWKDWWWSSNTLAICYEEPTHQKRPWRWEVLRAGGEQGDRGWDSWMASRTQWTWVWTNSRRQWRTGKSGMLQSMGLQRVGHNLATEQHEMYVLCFLKWLMNFSIDWLGKV